MFLSSLEPSSVPLWGLAAISLAAGLTLGLLGGMVGLVLGNLRLPVVFFLLDSAPEAAGTNIGISGLAALTGSWRHWKQRSIDWGMFWRMAPPSVAGGVVGGFFSERVPTSALLVTFSCVILVGAISTLLQARGAGALSNGGAREEAGRSPRRGLLSMAVGLAVGGLGGLVGLILGSLRLPAMLRLLRMDPRAAIGTNMALGLVTGASGVVGHLLGGGIDWVVLGLMGVSSATGSFYGARLTGLLSPRTLLRALGMILLVAAGAMFWQAVAEL